MLHVSAYGAVCVYLIFQVVTTGAVTQAPTEILSFNCTPYGNITANNPDPVNLIWVNATNDAKECLTEFINNNTQITIHNCALDEDIKVVFSSDPVGNPFIITEHTLKLFRIKCADVPSVGGITKHVVDKSHIRNIVTVSQAATVTPPIVLVSAIVDEETNEEQQMIEIGEKVNWNIDGPEGYSIFPLACTAYSGLVSDVVYSASIVENGCSLDTNLLSNFEYVTPEEPHRLQAQLFAFRFSNSDSVSLSCMCVGCPPNSDLCALPSCEGTRKRRNTPDDSNYVIRSTIKAEDIDFLEKLDKNKTMQLQEIAETNRRTDRETPNHSNLELEKREIKVIGNISKLDKIKTTNLRNIAHAGQRTEKTMRDSKSDTDQIKDVAKIAELEVISNAMARKNDNNLKLDTINEVNDLANATESEVHSMAKRAILRPQYVHNNKKKTGGMFKRQLVVTFRVYGEVKDDYYFYFSGSNKMFVDPCMVTVIWIYTGYLIYI